MLSDETPTKRSLASTAEHPVISCRTIQARDTRKSDRLVTSRIHDRRLVHCDNQVVTARERAVIRSQFKSIGAANRKRGGGTHGGPLCKNDRSGPPFPSPCISQRPRRGWRNPVTRPTPLCKN